MGVAMDPAPLLTDRAAYISYLEARAARAACRQRSGRSAGREMGRPRIAADAPLLRHAQRQLEAMTAACMQMNTLECRVEQARRLQAC
jgi:hypothetical protein